MVRAVALPFMLHSFAVGYQGDGGTDAGLCKLDTNWC
jgi:hypothetical protein